jgi:hypothetical protein
MSELGQTSMNISPSHTALLSVLQDAGSLHTSTGSLTKVYDVFLMKRPKEFRRNSEKFRRENRVRCYFTLCNHLHQPMSCRKYRKHT